MKNLIKLILLVGVIVFALFDYRVVSSKGFSKFDMTEDKSLVEFLQTLGSIEKIEYYKNIFPNDYKYLLYIETKDESFLFNAENEDINGLNVAGFLIDKLKPVKIDPIPIYVEIVFGSLILFSFFVPDNKRKE